MNEIMSVIVFCSDLFWDTVLPLLKTVLGASSVFALFLSPFVFVFSFCYALRSSKKNSTSADDEDR